MAQMTNIGQDRGLGLPFKLLFCVVAVFSLSLVVRPAPWVVDRPISEDGYYALTISHNIAEGKGVTIDGTTPTNGFQPLFVLACVPLFALAGHNKILAVRLVLGLSWILYLGTAVVMGKIVRDFVNLRGERQGRIAQWIGASLYLSAPLLFLQHFNGLETGAMLFLYALAWHCHQTNHANLLGKEILFAIVLGLIVLARIDAAFFVAIASFGQWVSGGGLTLRERSGRFFRLATTSLIVSSGWWVNNLVNFHSLMPSSGRAEQAWGFSVYRWERIVSALIRDLVPWVFAETPSDGIVGTAARSLTILLAIGLGIRHRKKISEFISGTDSRDQVAGRTIEYAFWLVSSIAVLAAWYGFSSWAVHFYTRYMAPLTLLATFVLGCAAAHLYRKLPRATTIIAALLITPVLTTNVLLWRGRPIRNGFLQEQVKLVERWAAQDTVAAGQSGTLGFFRDGVVNLDGKVNPRALEFQKTMWEYLPQVHAQWLCDWPSYVHTYLGEHPEKRGWKVVATEGTFLLLRYDPSAALQAETVSPPKPHPSAGP